LIASVDKEWTTADKQRTDSLVGDGREGRIEVAFAAQVQEKELLIRF
jgi:hypothetical protein